MMHVFFLAYKASHHKLVSGAGKTWGTCRATKSVRGYKRTVLVIWVRILKRLKSRQDVTAHRFLGHWNCNGSFFFDELTTRV
jgi:hypothetical protein